MKIGYVKQTFKCLIIEQLSQLSNQNCMEIKIVPSNNVDYVKTEISELSKGDEIIVVKLIVLANNIQELLEVLKLLEVKQIELKVLKSDFKNDKPIQLFQLVKMLDEFVKDVIRQKQIMGIIRAKAKGRHMGRPRKLNKVKLEKAINLRQYHTNQKVAKMLKVSKSTLLRNIAESKKLGRGLSTWAYLI